MATPKTLKGFRDFLPKKIRRLGRIAVFIDAANLQKSSQKLGWKIDYKALYRTLLSAGKLQFLGYYSVNPQTPDQTNFTSSLKRFGYTIISKPLKIIRTSDSQTLRKANFDVEIATDIATKLASFDTLILFSGDSDFAYSLELVKNSKKSTIVVSTKYRVSRELIQRCDYYLDLKKLKRLLSRKKSPSFSTGDKNNLSTAEIIISKK